MLAITRFRAPTPAGDLAGDLAELAEVLRAQHGCEEVLVARNLDDPGLFTLTSRWRNVGSYRRALGSHEVKLRTPLMAHAIDEPGAYEILTPGATLNQAMPRSIG